MLFPLGRLLVTPAVVGRLKLSDIYALVARHVGGDWGVVHRRMPSPTSTRFGKVYAS